VKGFDEATAVEPAGDGRWAARLADGYATNLGPFGGYVASLGLRVAAAAAEHPRVVGFQCQFLRVADPDGEVQATTTTVRRSSVAEAVRVELGQAAGGPVLVAQVLLAPALLAGVDRPPPEAVVPVVPPPSLLPTFDDLYTDIGSLPFAEGRPILEARIGSAPGLPAPPWGVGALQRHLGPQRPALRCWVRLTPDATFDDPALDAARVLMALDWLGSYVATSAYGGRRMIFHTTLDMAVSWHGSAPASEWLCCEVESPVASGGLAPAVGRVWAEDGTLLASGQQQMLQRVRF
jgi:acyl-CoA thioesterase